MKGYGKERYQSHQDSIGWKQKDSQPMEPWEQRQTYLNYAESWQRKTVAKWLADELGKDPATVSKWCTNSSQPSLETRVQVAEALDVDVRSLIVQTKKSRIEIEAEKLLNISSNQ